MKEEWLKECEQESSEGSESDNDDDLLHLPSQAQPDPAQ